MFFGQNDRPSLERIQRIRRDRSPRREQMFTPGWAGAVQASGPAPVEINTPRGGMTQHERQVTEAVVTQLAAGALSTEERIARLEAHANYAADAISKADGQLLGLANTVQSVSDATTKMEEALVNMVTQVTGTQSNLDLFK